MLGGGNGGSARAAEHHLYAVHRLAHDLEGVEQSRSGDDRGAVLVIVEYRDAQRAAQLLLDVEAIGSPDVLQVDAAHGGLQKLAEADDVVGVLRCHLQVEDVEVCELLEEVPLAFHHRLAGQRTDVAKPQHSGTIGDYGDQVTLGGVAVCLLLVLLDLPARLRDAGGVGESQVALVGQRFGGDHGDLAGASLRVVVERVLAFHPIGGRPECPLSAYPEGRDTAGARKRTDRSSPRGEVGS